MKTRIIIIILLLLVLTVLLTRNDEHISSALLNTINPVKQKYKQFTQGLEDKGQSYIFQEETIGKLNHENRILRKRLLEQMHYIKQVQNIYSVLPKLTKLPVHNISIAETISYVKLNSFSQIILTKPKNLEENKIYGLIQGTVVAGVSKIKNNQLYGYLTSDEKCRFSVFVGKTKAPGIAIGVKRNEMVVKFIPKWHHVKKGDKVYTSGLDEIFFSNIPVGIVTKVEVQSAYTIAYLKPYNNVLEPKTFFVVTDPKVTILDNFDNNSTHLQMDCPKPEDTRIARMNSENNESNITQEDANITIREQDVPEYNATIPVISSIPTRVDQTQDEVIEPEVPAEHTVVPVIHTTTPAARVKKTRHKKKKAYKPKVHSKSLDLF